jgi:hypothetical protein
MLAERDGRPDADDAGRARRIECYRNAAAAGQPIGLLGAAGLLVLQKAPSAEDIAQGTRLLLEYADIDDPTGIDPSKDAAAFRSAAGQAIAERAALGAPRAMAAHAMLLMPAGGDWVVAADLAAGRAQFPTWFYERMAEPDGRAVLGAARIAWECGMRLDRLGCLAERAQRAERSAPERSTVARALRALLEGTLDEALARDAAAADEVFSIKSMQALRTAAANWDHLRGGARLCGMLDADEPSDANVWDMLAVTLRQQESPIEGVPREDLVRLAAALHYYGIGVPASRIEAAAVLLATEAPIDRASMAGFAAQGITDAQAAELAVQTKRWNPQWWAGGSRPN